MARLKNGGNLSYGNLVSYRVYVSIQVPSTGDVGRREGDRGQPVPAPLQAHQEDSARQILQGTWLSLFGVLKMSSLSL